MHDEVGILADAMHEATLGGGGILLPRPAPRGLPPATPAAATAAATAALDPLADEPPRQATAAPPRHATAAPPTGSLASLAASGAAASRAAASRAATQAARELLGRGASSGDGEVLQGRAGHGASSPALGDVRGEMGARREAAAHRLVEAHRRLDYEDALASARSAGPQRERGEWRRHSHH